MMELDHAALAKKGAQMRLGELEQEREGLVAFINGGTPPPPPMAKRPRLSAATRKKMSQAARARWAAKEAAEG